MKKSAVFILLLFLTTTTFAQKKKDLIKQVATLESQKDEIQKKLAALQKAQEVNLENELQNFSYALGVSMGNDLKNSGADSLSYMAFALGTEDVMVGAEKIEVSEANKKVKDYLARLKEAISERLKEEGKAFLVENAKRPEVTTTESGLQYEILTSADGARPVETDQVKVHYAGSLIDGSEFDSSIARGEPYVLGLNEVIKGWTEALQLMPAGSRWKLYIPYELGYGERGAGNGIIPAYATLIFEIELIEIVEE